METLEDRVRRLEKDFKERNEKRSREDMKKDLEQHQAMLASKKIKKSKKKKQKKEDWKRSGRIPRNIWLFFESLRKGKEPGWGSEISEADYRFVRGCYNQLCPPPVGLGYPKLSNSQMRVVVKIYERYQNKDVRE